MLHTVPSGKLLIQDVVNDSVVVSGARVVVATVVVVVGVVIGTVVVLVVVIVVVVAVVSEGQ